jgi:MOSC domain-containing protein YiiM
MGKVLEIGIAANKGDQIKNVNKVEAIMSKGLLNDRKFKDNNHKESQVTLIEIEHINYFNNISKCNIKAIDFRRNIITDNIKLNNLVGSDFFVGNVKLRGHDLCRPCKYLQDKLHKNNFIKEFLLKGGLRCEILTSGEIKVGDIIKNI